MTARRWLMTLVQAALIAGALLYLATSFDVPFVSEAEGGQRPSVSPLSRPDGLQF